MKKTLMVFAVLLFVVFAYAQAPLSTPLRGGKNGVTQTAQAESTPAAAVSTAVADSSSTTVESKTIKTEIQSPGVVTEYKEDGTKVVTINLSEIDENKLPERYEANVILEAPIYDFSYVKEVFEIFSDANFIKTNGKSYTKSSTFLVGNPTDGLPYIESIKVSADENGNIYFLDVLNSRIQKFNNKGDHVKNIPIKDSYYRRWNEVKGDWDDRNIKSDFLVRENMIFVKDLSKGFIENIDEKGELIKTIEVAKLIGVLKTRDMKSLLDGIGVTSNKEAFETRSWNTEIKYYNEMVRLNDLKKWIINNKIEVILKSVSGTIINVDNLFSDINSYYFNFGLYLGRNNKELNIQNKIVEISKDGEIRSLINFDKYWNEPEWIDKCGNKPKTWSGNTFENLLFDKFGSVYLLQYVCCQEKGCVSTIRVIKLSPEKMKNDN